MRHGCASLAVGLVASLVAALVAPAHAAGEKVAAEWRFGGSKKWNGWTPNGEVRKVTFDADSVSFETVGSDPIIVGPSFDLPQATNQQWVVMDLDCSAPADGELFYANKTEGPYGGFEPKWVTDLVVPAAGRQEIVVWPFWEGLHRIIRLRFDPPSGVHCRLLSIRIMELTESVGPPAWRFRDASDPWRPMLGARVEHNSSGLVAHATVPQAMIGTVVEPFDAARRSILKLEANCAGEDTITFYWATKEEPGLYGEPIRLRAAESPGLVSLDLRCFPAWRGTITHLAIAFGTFGTETLTLRSLSMDENDAKRPYARLRYLAFEQAINRPGKAAALDMILEHAGGPPIPAGPATLTTDARSRCPGPALSIPAIQPGQKAEAHGVLIPQSAGPTAVTFKFNGQAFTRTLRIDEAIKDPQALQRPPDNYDVPVPRPVRTDYQIGIYYFPGWSPDQMSRWKSQTDFPERDPVLGWYEEGRPEVADWHIKWAVENGLSFFVYDWYWRDGKEELRQGLNDGFLKARYRDELKFAVMWANHPPFANHTPEQLLKVTDYWIEHYFRQPNYLMVDGKPYVSFFSVGQVLSDLGSPEKVRKAFEGMRKRVRDAGLAGLHIAGCGAGDVASLKRMKQAGFDSVTGYNYRRTGASMLQSPYRQFLLGHEQIWQRIQKADTLPYIPLLTVGWDSRPWHGLRAEQRFARRTQDFAEVLGRLKANLNASGGRMAILEAWNEWGEGSYIEPNVEFGFKDLEAIRRTFAHPGDWPINIGPDDLGLGDKYDLRRK